MLRQNEIIADIKVLSMKADTPSEHADSLRQKNQVLKMSINELDNYWKGEAAEKFKENFSNILTLLDEYQQCIMKFSSEHKFALKQYNDCLEQAEEIFAAIDI